MRKVSKLKSAIKSRRFEPIHQLLHPLPGNTEGGFDLESIFALKQKLNDIQRFKQFAFKQQLDDIRCFQQLGLYLNSAIVFIFFSNSL